MAASQRGSVTRLLRRVSGGDQEALHELMPLLYRELRAIAGRALRRERPDHTLQTTALVHEAFLRLVNQRDVEWQERAHFFAVAARLMRRILVDHARKRARGRRAGLGHRVALDDVAGTGDRHPVDLCALDEALDRLAELDAQQSRVVELRYFTGLTIEETAEVLGVSPATVKRDWATAKAWLRREIEREA